MANLLSRGIALAEYLLATGVDRAVRRLVPYLEQAARLDVPSIAIWVAISLTRRGALHMTVRIIYTRSLKLLHLRHVVGLTLAHVGSRAVLEQARQLNLRRLVLQNLVRVRHATEVGEGVA